MVHDVLQGIAADAVLLHQLPIEVGHLYFVFLEAGTPLGAVLTPEEFLQAVTDLSLLITQCVLGQLKSLGSPVDRLLSVVPYPGSIRALA